MKGTCDAKDVVPIAPAQLIPYNFLKGKVVA
jgi:hypothetical protein